MLVFRGWLALLVGLLFAAVTGAIVGLQPAKYQAEAIVSVGSAGSTNGALALATSDRVQQAVAQLSGLSISPSQWQAETTLDAPGGGLIRLWVVTGDGPQAMKIAASWGEALVGVLTQLEPSPGGNSAAEPRVVSQPVQVTRVPSQVGLKMLTSGILGLVIGLIAVLTLRAGKAPG